MPEENGEGLIARLMRENSLLTKHGESWARDYQSLAKKLDAADRQCHLLRTALVNLVGVDGREDLEQLEAVMRLMLAPAQDRAATIDAIHALIVTLEEPEAVAAVDPVDEKVTG